MRMNNGKWFKSWIAFYNNTNTITKSIAYVVVLSKQFEEFEFDMNFKHSFF